jgi:hypothetical protein
MSDIQVNVSPEGEAPSSALTPEPGPTENDVAIAAIQAQTAIEINNANNETAIELAEIHAEATETLHNESDDTQWRLNSLEERNRELEAEIARLKEANLVSSPPEQVAEEILEAIAEEPPQTDLTPQSTSGETVSTETEPSEKSAEESLTLEIPPLLEVEPKRKIMLV